MWEWVSVCVYVCMCVCYVWVCVCVYMWEWMSVCVCMCVYVWICVYVCVCVSVCMFVYVWVSVCVCMYVCECMFECVCVCVCQCMCECVWSDFRVAWAAQQCQVTYVINLLHSLVLCWHLSNDNNRMYCMLKDIHVEHVRTLLCHNRCHFSDTLFLPYQLNNKPGSLFQLLHVSIPCAFIPCRCVSVVHDGHIYLKPRISPVGIKSSNSILRIISME